MNLSRYINIFHGSATLFKNHYEHFTKSLKYVIVRTGTFQHTLKILESNIMFKHIDEFKYQMLNITKLRKHSLCNISTESDL